MLLIFPEEPSKNISGIYIYPVNLKKYSNYP